MEVIFTGDISFTGIFKEKVENNLEIFSDDILNYLQKSNFIVGNLEGPITASTIFFDDTFAIKSPLKSSKYLKSRNINVLNLANNHILDFGEIGLKETLIELERENISFFGANLNSKNTTKPIILKKNNISLAIFGIAKCDVLKRENAQVFSSNEFIELKKQVKEYKNKVDYIFVNFHGGEEFTSFPSPVKRRFLKKLANIKEIDCVIAHHSHTFQGYENYKGTPIFYSLGNFIFDIPNHDFFPETKNGALLKFDFTKNNFSFKFKPFKIIEGKIIETNEINFKEKLVALCNFKDYITKWQQEAFKVLFRKENPFINKNDEDENALQKKSLLSLFVSKKFYSKALFILRDSYLFSTYFHAIIYKFRMKARL